jgi:MarR family 2-MHQ and catechol resistance regulon transcriptional repressor
MNPLSLFLACKLLGSRVFAQLVATDNQYASILPVSPETTLPSVAATDPLLARDTAEVYDALSELVRVYQFRDRDRICCYDVSVTQCYALEALVRRGGATLNDLAAQLYLDKSTASRVVDALERKGYVTRLTHPEDRRAVLLDVTSEGRTLEGKIRDSILAEERDLLAGFAPDVRQAMAQLLRRLARAAAARTGGEPTSCCQLP